MSRIPSPLVQRALHGIRQAWTACCEDYSVRKLNSERSLQAAFYYHLRTALDKDYRIFVEARVLLKAAEGSEEETDKSIFIDTLVCSADKQVLVAVELKYTPRSRPGTNAARKDLESLSRMRNHLDKRIMIELVRHGGTAEGDRYPLKVSPDARMVLAMFIAKRKKAFDVNEFWSGHVPTAGAWKTRTQKLPPRLGVCVALAGSETAEPYCLGRPFEVDAPL